MQKGRFEVTIRNKKDPAKTRKAYHVDAKEICGHKDSEWEIIPEKKPSNETETSVNETPVTDSPAPGGISDEDPPEVESPVKKTAKKKAK